MARVNIDILGINELKWTGMGEFNLDDFYIYYCGQESLRRRDLGLFKGKMNTCIPVADSFWYLAKLIQFCKVYK